MTRSHIELDRSNGDPSPGGSAVDKTAAMRFLDDRFNGRAVLGPDLPQGEWSRAFAFMVEGRDHVIRFNPDRAAFDIDRVAMRFASPAIPVPAVTEVGEALGGFYAISDRASGSFLEELAASDFLRTLPSLFATLDAMRVADTAGSAGFGPWNSQGDGRYGSWRDYLVDVASEAPEAWRPGWRMQLDGSALARRAFDSGFQTLSELVAGCPENRNLIHSDLINRNLLVTDHQVTALIDWQCAMYGDFLYELAWFTFWAPWHPGLSTVDFRGQATERYGADQPALAGFDDRVRCYEIHIGLRHLVYNAWRRNRDNLDATARRTLQVLV